MLYRADNKHDGQQERRNERGMGRFQSATMCFSRIHFFLSGAYLPPACKLPGCARYHPRKITYGFFRAEWAALE